MPSGDPASQGTLRSAFNVSTIDIKLNGDSKKRIEFIVIELKLNDGSLRSIQKTVTIGAAGVHREEFDPPLWGVRRNCTYTYALKADGHVSLSVGCCLPWKRTANIPIVINLLDSEHMRDDQGTRSYRKKIRSVEVLVTGHHPGHQSLVATTASIIELCSRFRLLIIGNTGVGKSSVLHKVFGVEGVHLSEADRGEANIDKEFISPTNERFVVHDSPGFEAGDRTNMEIVKNFVDRRKAMSELTDQLHAIWLCLELPYAGGRLLDGGAEQFLQRRREILGEIPLVVVLTKADLLDFQLRLDLPENEDAQQYKSKYLDKYCFGPLYEAAGRDIAHVTVSTHDGYSESLSTLVGTTLENMKKYHVHEAPRFVASIAQRVSIKEKIELSIVIGKTKYWDMLLKSAVFGGHTLQEYLQVIRKDVVTVWNFDDPNNCLMNDNIIGALLRTDNLGNPSEVTLMASLASFVTSPLKLLSGSGEMEMSAIVGPMRDIVAAVTRMAHSAEDDVKLIMGYVVDLVCAMQAIFVLAFGGSVTVDKVVLAIRAYEQPRKVVHQKVDAFDGKLERDRVLDMVEHLIWRYSITDRDIEETRRKI